MSDCIVVMTTTKTKEEAVKIAYEILNNKLGTCVQIIGPIDSIYRWHGKIERAQEYQLQIKSIQSAFKALDSHIREMHPYEVPEIIVLPIVDGSMTYLNWVRDELK